LYFARIFSKLSYFVENLARFQTKNELPNLV